MLDPSARTFEILAETCWCTTFPAIGVVIGLGLERALNSFLFNAGGVDILAYAIVVPSLLVVTMLAAYVPARRAARIAPTQALRYE